jgi:outer membrane receptor protein involved in Fe transport
MDQRAKGREKRSAAERDDEMNKHAVVAPLLAWVLAINAHAGTDAEVASLLQLSMEDLLSQKIRISTHTAQTLSRAPSVVSVITAEDIRATGATNLREILQSVPGIYVRANLFGFRPQVTFRGAAAGHTLLMVDGAPMRDLVWAAGIFGKGLPTSMIDRIEIIRGPGSALFGSDASAGVINVITRSAGRIDQSEVGARLGSFDSQSGWLRHGGHWNGFDIGFTADVSHTDGHAPFIPADGQTASDAQSGSLVSFAPGHAGYGWNGADLRFSAARDNWRLLAGQTFHHDLEIGLTGAAVLDPLTRGRDSRSDLALYYDNDQFGGDWGVNAELRYYHLDYSSGEGFHERPAGYVDATGTYPDGLINRMRSAERGFGFELSGQYSGVKGHALRIGGGHNIKDLYRVEQYVNFGTGPDGNPLVAGGDLVDVSDTPYAFAPEKVRRINHLFVQDIWTLSPDWELTAGARYDHYSDFGSTFNPRAALVWQSTDRLTTKLMYGQAFRAPSYLELYARTAATTPNPALTPERSSTWDLSLQYLASRDLRLGLNLYQFRQTNLIADVLGQFHNVGDRTSSGFEFEAQWQATRNLRLAGNLTRSHEDDSAFRSPSLPETTAYLRADWKFQPGWHWNVQAHWVGERELPAGDPRAPLKAYALVDTTLRYAPNSDWAFAASIRNLFDADAREYSSRSISGNLPLPERSVYLEAKYAF